MPVEDTNRWVGLLVTLGVMAPLALWFVLDRASPRLRALFGVTSALLLGIATTVGLFGSMVVGAMLAMPEGFNDDGDDKRVLVVVLALVGLALGLAAAVGLPRLVPPAPDPVDGVSLDEVPADDLTADDLTADDLTVEDEPPIEEEPPVTDPVEEHWASHTAAASVPAALPLDGGVLSLLLVTVAFSLPLVGFGALPALARATRFGGDVNGWAVAALLLAGLSSGLALLLPAMSLRMRSAPVVAGAFLVVGALQGVAAAWPESFTSEVWLAFGLALTAGLLAPTFLRLMSPALARDGGALTGGVLIVVVLLTAVSACVMRATVSTIEDLSTSIDQDDVTVIPGPDRTFAPFPVPTLPDFPTDFPSFTIPTFPTFSPVP